MLKLNIQDIVDKLKKFDSIEGCWLSGPFFDSKIDTSDTLTFYVKLKKQEESLELEIEDAIYELTKNELHFCTNIEELSEERRKEIRYNCPKIYEVYWDEVPPLFFKDFK